MNHLPLALRTLVLMICMLPVWSCSGPDSAGLYEVPVFLTSNLRVSAVNPPQSTSGQQVEYQATWDDGREPFTVTWQIEGTEPTNFSALQLQREDTVVFTIPEVEQEQLLPAIVVVTDVHGNSVTRSFSVPATP